MDKKEIIEIVRTTLWVVDSPFDAATVAADVIEDGVVAIVRATLQLVDCPFDAATVAADVIDRLEWARIRAESDADPRFTRCQECGNGNGACAC